MWEERLSRVQDRSREMDFEAERDRLAEQAVSWRRASSGATFYWLLPLIVQSAPSIEGCWLDEQDDEPVADSVGFDDRGRPVLVLRGPTEPGRPILGWSYDGPDGAVEEIDFVKSWVRWVPQEPEAGAVNVGAGRTLGGVLEVTLLEWVGEKIVRTRSARRVRDLPPAAIAHEALWGDDGQLVAILKGVEGPLVEAGDGVGGLRAALERAQAIKPSQVLWDARIDRPEAWRPNMVNQASILVDACALAIGEGLRVAGMEAMAWVDVQVGVVGPRQQLPPRVRVAASTFVDRALQRGVRELDLLDEVWSANDDGRDVVELELLDHFDEDALRLCRAISSATDKGVSRDNRHQAHRVLRELADSLSARLAENASLHGSIVLVHLPSGSSDPTFAEALRRARDVFGTERVDAFLRSVGG